MTSGIDDEDDEDDDDEDDEEGDDVGRRTPIIGWCLLFDIFVVFCDYKAAQREEYILQDSTAYK